MPPIPQGDSPTTGKVRSTGLPLNRFVGHARTFSPAAFGLVALCFFLPFVHVSCGGERVTTFSGIQLVVGTEVSDAEIGRNLRSSMGMGAGMELPPELRNPSDQKVDPELWAVVAFAAAVVGVVISFVKDKRGWIGGVAAGAVGAVALLLLKLKIDGEVAREGEGLLQVQYAAGYCLALVVLVGAAALHGYFLLAAQEPPKRAWNGILP
ncbi:MAG: hypothetical protein JW955_12120 [Sedimentisphaerales bacterium]|nr:hypothetical protein [Sedimentisphaerales bacterium]